jgi:HrpA-like RNA helicase
LATYSSDKSNQQPLPHLTQASWGFVKRAMTVKAILAGIALVGSGGFLTTLVYVNSVASSDENKIKERFNNPITITADLDDYVPRTDVESSLKKILTADKVYNYWVVSGEHGTGKTTTVQKVCNEIGKGIIYVDVPKDVEDFKDALAQAIGLNHRKHGRIWAFLHETVYGQEPLPSIFCY